MSKKKLLKTVSTKGLIATSLLLSVLVLTILNLGNKQNTNSKAASNYYIQINQSAPKYGDNVNFTTVYPKEGDKKIGRQQMYQPQIQVLCSQNNTRVFVGLTTVVSRIQNGDGTVTGISGDVHLGGTGSTAGFQNTWVGGAADCTVNIVYYITKNLNPVFVASSQFVVSE